MTGLQSPPSSDDLRMPRREKERSVRHQRVANERGAGGGGRVEMVWHSRRDSVAMQLGGVDRLDVATVILEAVRHKQVAVVSSDGDRRGGGGRHETD